MRQREKNPWDIYGMCPDCNGKGKDARGAICWVCDETGVDPVPQAAREELTALRAKAAAGEKLRRVCDELPELTVFVDNAGLERTECMDCGARIVFDGETRHVGSCSVSLFKHALDEYDAVGK